MTLSDHEGQFILLVKDFLNHMHHTSVGFTDISQKAAFPADMSPQKEFDL